MHSLTYPSDSSNIFSTCIGSNTIIWQYCVILEGAIIGNECNICSHVFIENKVTVGNRVTIKNSSLIYDGVEIHDHVFVGPRVVFANDMYPKSKNYLEAYPTTVIQRNASIGAGSIILPGITVGENSLVGAGSVVTKDVPPNVIVVGSPARFLRSVG